MTRPVVRKQNTANAAQIEALTQLVRELTQRLAQVEANDRLTGREIAKISEQQREARRELAELRDQG